MASGSLLLRSRLHRGAAVLLAVCAVLALDTWLRPPLPAPAQAVWPSQPVAVAQLQRQDGGLIPMPPDTPAAHAGFLLAMPESARHALTAFWFAGERESASNVQIAASQWDRQTRQWTPAQFVVNRHVVAQQLGFGVRRLGNPVAWLDASHRMHLYVVATGWGGWAASRIVHLRQVGDAGDDSALRFESVGVLPLSWCWNTSFLVRNAPLTLRDGGAMLPVYFELGAKYPVMVRLDAQGAFVQQVRVSRRHDALQPTLLMQDATQWLALLRDQRPQGKVGVAGTADGGQHWSDLPDLALDNPDAAVAALALAPGQMLLAHNPSTQSRTALDLSHSADGIAWKPLAALERGVDGEEFSYPSLAWVDGSLWVSYTHQRKRIAWQRFGERAAGMEARP